MQKVQFTETVLRDANQSLIATRMKFNEFQPILAKLDKAGYYSLECWGGATFDSCLRYLNEDPWERLRKIKKACPNTKLQMLLRGQNLLGYHHYPDDVVRMFVKKSIENGIDIIRIFDALNDVKNIEVAVDETVKNGAIASGAICYTISPIHTLDSYVELAKNMQSLGCQTIAIKDMAGILSPAEAYKLVSSLKEAVDLPLVLHTHCTTGLGFMTCLKAVEAGVDVLDTAISSMSGGTAQPATETLNYTLAELGYETGLNSKSLQEIAEFFKPIRAKALESGLLNPTVLTTDTKALDYQVPGGMLSNLVAQLTAQGKMDKFDEVLLETPRVREDLGYPPLVTPMSQMVGVQATANVLAGERYKNVSKEVKSYLMGEYGTAPGKVNEDVKKQILGDEKGIEGRYADTLEPAFEKAKAEIGDKAKSDEDVLSYIAFPTQAENFFDYREKMAGKIYDYEFKAID
ncbi:MAG: pyruvate carboxylase subunit B [Clostridia bacterium]|nr:pyruvate carboxylase subunit B [Clostridia bacterium]